MKTRVWRWRRRIGAASREAWQERLETLDSSIFWTLTEKPSGRLCLIEAYSTSARDLRALVPGWGGAVQEVDGQAWLKTPPAPPTRIGRKLEIVDDESAPASGIPRLVIPHGVAFGSGEHATTFMLLRALTRRADWEKTQVLDLGTGSGVLALAARRFGATRIMGTDFDPNAVRTARQNEDMNFPKSIIVWRQADVKRLSAREKFDLVLANLFSGILVEAAPRIAASVARGGELWLSGILRTQEAEVTRAYRRLGLRLTSGKRRGKWVMLAFGKAK